MSTEHFLLSRRRMVCCAGAWVVAVLTAFVGVAILRPEQGHLPKPMTRAPSVRSPEHRSGAAHFDLLARFLADDRRGRDEHAALCAISDPASDFRVPSQEHPLLDGPAPLFSLADQDGRKWSLAEKLERGPVVLVFYLNFGCDACVSRLFELNADIRLFQALGAEVVAISDDPPELTQGQFRRYGAISFPVLSDPGHHVARAYSIVSPAEAGQSERILHGTFVIGGDRNVKWAQTGDSPFTPDTATLCELARLNPERVPAREKSAAAPGAEDP